MRQLQGTTRDSRGDGNQGRSSWPLLLAALACPLVTIVAVLLTVIR